MNVVCPYFYVKALAGSVMEDNCLELFCPKAFSPLLSRGHWFLSARCGQERIYVTLDLNNWGGLSYSNNF